MAQNPRKEPFQIRRGSKKEFSRVSAMTIARIEAIEARVAVLENELAKTGESRVRAKKKKPDEVKPE